MCRADVAGDVPSAFAVAVTKRNISKITDIRDNCQGLLSVQSFRTHYSYTFYNTAALDYSRGSAQLVSGQVWWL